MIAGNADAMTAETSSTSEELTLRAIADLVALDRPLGIVDVGANPLDTPLYQSLLDAGLCHVYAFEPQAETMTGLTDHPAITVLPWALGDGEPIDLHICEHSGWTSPLPPCASTLALFEQYRSNATVLETVRVPTRPLDGVAEIGEVDFIKIDTQGWEQIIIAHGRDTLQRCVMMQLEVSFVPLYEGQPSFADIHGEAMDQGFLFHCFGSAKKAIIPPMLIGNDPWRTVNQLLDADAVYVRDLRRLAEFETFQLKATAVLAHALYGSWDLSLRAICELEQRGAIPAGGGAAYVDLVNQRSPA